MPQSPPLVWPPRSGLVLRGRRRWGLVAILLTSAIAAAAVALVLAFRTAWASDADEAELLVQVVCAECRTCGRAERAAIAHVAMRRVSMGLGDTLSEVLLADGQFAPPTSRWCGPDLPVADAPGGRWSAGMERRQDRWMASLRAEMAMVLSGRSGDPLSGPAPTHFHVRSLCRADVRPPLCGRVWGPPGYEEAPVPSEWKHRFFRMSETTLALR